MSDYIFDDYDKFIGKHITVIYECGSICKKIHCNLIESYRKKSKGKVIILKADNNTIYHINCNKIICLVAGYEDMFTENEDNHKVDSKPSEANKNIQSEDLSLNESKDIETIHSETITPNENTIYVELQENNVIPSGDISDEQIISSIMTDMELNYNMFAENEDDYKLDTKSIEANTNIQSEEVPLKRVQDIENIPSKSIIANSELPDVEPLQNKEHINISSVISSNENDLSSSIATFINSNFQGAYLTIYTSSTQAISGEVIFNYDYLIVLKSDAKNYYINPEQITYFK